MKSLLLIAVLGVSRLATYADDETDCEGNTVVCEMSGSKIARGFNLLRFRLDLAKTAMRAKRKDSCQVEAQAAVALSIGLPKFRQKLKDAAEWEPGRSYQTRWDGTLAEEPAFAKIAAMGAEARKLFTDCGGKTMKTTDADETAFQPREDVE